MINLFGTITPPPIPEPVAEADLAERILMAMWPGQSLNTTRRHYESALPQLRKALVEQGITDKPMGDVAFDGWANVYEDDGECILHRTKNQAERAIVGKGKPIRVRVVRVEEDVT